MNFLKRTYKRIISIIVVASLIATSGYLVTGALGKQVTITVDNHFLSFSFQSTTILASPADGEYFWINGIPRWTEDLYYWVNGVPFVIIDATTSTPDITIDPDPASKAFGVVEVNTTYYAKGSAPNNPVVLGDCTYTIINSGTSAVDLDINIADYTGGVGWNIAAIPAANEVKITAYYVGQNPAAGLVLTNADQEFYDNLAASANISLDFAMLTGSSFTDGVAKSTTMTITARAHT